MKFDIKIPLYNQTITVSDDMPDKYKSDYAAGFEYETQTLYYQAEVFTPDRIAHECVHIANWICERVGIALEYRNDESLAYLVQYLFANISKKVNTQEKKHANKRKENGKRKN